MFELVVLQGKTNYKCFFWDRSKFSFRICDPSPNAFHLRKAMSISEFEMIGFDRSNLSFFPFDRTCTYIENGTIQKTRDLGFNDMCMQHAEHLAFTFCFESVL